MNPLIRHAPLQPWQIDTPQRFASPGRFMLESDAIEDLHVC
jgi:hypothetical protein